MYIDLRLNIKHVGMEKMPFTSRVSNASGFYRRAIASPVNSAYFRAIQEQFGAIPRNGIPIGGYNEYNKKNLICLNFV